MVVCDLDVSQLQHLEKFELICIKPEVNLVKLHAQNFNVDTRKNR